MTPSLMRRILIAARIAPMAAASLAAVPAESIATMAATTASGAISSDEYRTDATGRAPTGNPLWAISLKELSATRKRPIFSPTRRLLAVAVATAPNGRPVQPGKSAEPERPLLLLVGTIASNKESFGIFLDRSANAALRLKTGEQHKGWILREVRNRETILEKGDQTATLALPARTVEDKKNLKRFQR